MKSEGEKERRVKMKGRGDKEEKWSCEGFTLLCERTLGTEGLLRCFYLPPSSRVTFMSYFRLTVIMHHSFTVDTKQSLKKN